ncbi:MAG: FAD binding domain-containing protein [Eubacteriales bacterium]|nr:FAD binding domain-containing protein [Eubacteriales bacterium]
MYTVKNYVLAGSLEQAAELRQKSKNNVIIGGNLWLKMGHRTIQNAIDLSRLELNQIEEEENGFRIGCMVTLRDLETHRGLANYFGDIFQEAVRHIVGVQFRNEATVGGSIFPRFGFSDVLTVFLACGSEVELYRGGRVALADFINMPLDNDILTHMYVPKEGRKICYESFRQTETDFPVLTCAVIKKQDGFETVLGARPKQALLVSEVSLSCPEKREERERYARQVAEKAEFGSNMRGSAQYRAALAKVLIQRGLERLMEEATCR